GEVPRPGSAADGKDDGRGRPALARHERGTARISIRAEIRPVDPEIGIGHERRVEHDMWRIGTDHALFVWHDVLGREHVIDAWTRRRLENAFGKRLCHEAPDLVGALALGPQLGHLEDAW